MVHRSYYNIETEAGILSPTGFFVAVVAPRTGKIKNFLKEETLSTKSYTALCIQVKLQSWNLRHLLRNFI